MRSAIFTLFLVPFLGQLASAQSLPFTINNFSLPVTGVNSTYTTALTSPAGGTATVSGAGLSNQSATLTATGTFARDRGLNCGNVFQLAITFNFNSVNSISVLASGLTSGNGSTSTLNFTVTGGTGLFQGAGGNGTITGTLTQTGSGAGTITGNGSGNLVAGAPPAPVISPSGIVPVYSSVPIIQPGSWISIYGANFASGLSVWNGDFPKSLGGVSVKIDNKDAFLWFASPGQINAQVPDDNIQGCVNVAVTTPNGTANSQVTLQPAQPSFSLWDGTQYAKGFIRPADGSYVYLGPTTGLAVQAKPAKAGDTVELYGVGFGPVAHSVPAGQLDTVTVANATNFSVNVTVGGKPATVLYAGLSQAGSYQLDFIVPQVPAGDNLVIATVNAPNPQLFSANQTQNCQDPDPQGAAPTTCKIYIPIQ